MKTWDITKLELHPHSPQIISSTDDARAIVIEIPAGESMTDHQVHERAWVTVIAGEVEITADNQQPVTGSTGLLVEFDPRERHAVHARTNARILLLLTPWPGEGHPGALTLQAKAHARQDAAEHQQQPVPADPFHVVIAGGGVAAVEVALALHDLAGPRVRLTLVSPQPQFVLRALRTAEPFAADHVRKHSLRELADRVGANLVTDTVIAVDAGRHAVRLAQNGSLRYDALVLAVGARHRTALPRAITFTGDRSTLAYNGLLADLEEHWTSSVAFVVPPGTTWPLPLYELALMTARDVQAMGIDDTRLHLITPEATPLAIFGPHASQAVATMLDRAGVSFVGDTHAQQTADGRLALLPSDELLDADRVVALPTIEGTQIPGVPGDERGFTPVDDHGRVQGLIDVYAAGDGTTYPVKQGGLACQQADAIAELLAAAAGADIDPQPFRPVLRGRLLTGHHAHYPMHDQTTDHAAPELRLWSAPHKINGRYLTPWLQELDADAAPEATPQEPHINVDVALPDTRRPGRETMRLDPYSPPPAR
ncbi:MAG: FAD-dependent oxidoreductase [Solirubrobacteraceae bacterium]